MRSIFSPMKFNFLPLEKNVQKTYAIVAVKILRFGYIETIIEYK